MVSRRRTLAFVAATLTAAALSACGFQLRGSTPQSNLPFSTVYIGFPENSTLGTELRRYLRADERVKIVSDPKTAQALIEPLAETRSKSILTLNPQGRIREYSLFYRLSFQVKGPGDSLLLPPTELVAKRDISFNESQAIAKEKEEEVLYRDMQSDLVQQVLRRLAAIKPR